VEFRLTEDRWCPNCEKLFQATVVLIMTQDGEDKVRKSTETACPNCGTPGDRLI
jgi:hypothetical protein